MEGINIRKIKLTLKPIMIVISIISIVFVAYVFFFTQIGDRFAKYHNYADVVVRVDSKQLNLKGFKVNRIIEDGVVLEKSIFDDFYSNKTNDRQGNIVKFKEGVYGRNVFEIDIPKTYLKEFNNDIKVRFGSFNTNWWHINRYTINVDINQMSNDRANIAIYQKNLHRTDGRELIVTEEKESKVVTPSDNIISITTGP